MTAAPHIRAALVLAAALALAPHALAQDMAQPDGWDAELRMAAPEDMNPDPAVLEFDLQAGVTDMEIIPGATTPVWAYNGQLPGPLIRARVGDRLIVHFTNNLPEETTIHWHGVRVPNAMDGTPRLTQQPVAPGETFTYDFTFEDAGTFWYHPHLNSPHQVSRGLYGAIVVEDPAEPEIPGDELVLVLSDMALNDDGSFQESDRGGTFGDLFGREGDTILVNGKVAPTVKVRAGLQQRWRIVDAAITRYFPIALRGHTWTRIGGDGGLMERPEELPRMVMAPGERIDVVFTPAAEPGSTGNLAYLPVDRGWGTAVGGRRVPYLNVETVEAPAVDPLPVPQRLRAIETIDLAGAAEKRITLDIMGGDVTSQMMGVNGEAHTHMLETQVGATEIWTVENTSDFDHPFHLHGYFFQVLDDERIPEWKDTVNIPDHTTLRLAVRFDDRPGLWMVHCHILDHAEAGMMATLLVRDKSGAPPQLISTGAQMDHSAH